MHTIFSMLARDHDLIDAQFARACCQARARDMDGAALALAGLAATLERHLQIEEGVVFAAYDAALAPGAHSTAVLRAEHGQIRGMLCRMADSVAAGEREAFLKHAGTLRLVLQQHNEKEERVFYPLAGALLLAQREGIAAAIAAAS